MKPVTRQSAYVAGCRAGMDPPEPFVVPEEFQAFAGDWESGYYQTCTATGIHYVPEEFRAKPPKKSRSTALAEPVPAALPKPIPKSSGPKALTSMAHILDETIASHAQ